MLLAPIMTTIETSASTAEVGSFIHAWHNEAPHGGRSSARLERQVVALEVGGSSPLDHPIRWPAPRNSVPALRSVWWTAASIA